MDNEKNYKYVDNRSILVIDKTGDIQRFYCPFKVINTMKEISTVRAIRQDNHHKIQYLINGTYILYSYFEII